MTSNHSAANDRLERPLLEVVARYLHAAGGVRLQERWPQDGAFQLSILVELKSNPVIEVEYSWEFRAEEEVEVSVETKGHHQIHLVLAPNAPNRRVFLGLALKGPSGLHLYLREHFLKIHTIPVSLPALNLARAAEAVQVGVEREAELAGILAVFWEAGAELKLELELELHAQNRVVGWSTMPTGAEHLRKIRHHGSAAERCCCLWAAGVAHKRKIARWYSMGEAVQIWLVSCGMLD